MDFNPFELLKNAQKIQEQMSGFQQKLADVVVTGSAGGGMAEIDMNGRLEVLAVRISPEVVDPKEVSLLQDLLKAAFSDASEKIRESIRQELGNVSGGMNLPPGLMGL